MRIILAAAALAAALSAGAQEVTLRMHHSAPRHAPAHALLAAPWAAKLEKDSGGRLRIEVHPALELGGSAAHLAADARTGEVDIVLAPIAASSRRFPRTEVFELPFVGADPMASTWALQDYYDRHLVEEYRDYRVILLFAQDGAALHLRRPVRRLEDFKGLKIRAAGAGGGVFLRAVGATAIGAPAPELPGLLENGLLDGCLAPFGAVSELGLHKLVRHHVALEARAGSVLALLMNRGRYLELAPPLRRLLDAHSGRHLAWYAGKTWTEAEAPGLAAAKGEANELTSFAPAEAARIRAAVQAETARFLAELSRYGGFDALALYRDAQELVAKYRKP